MPLHYFADRNVSLRNKSLAVDYIRLKLSSDDCNSGKLSFSQQWLWKFFWNVTPCSLVEVYQCCGETCSFGINSFLHGDDGGSSILQNVISLLPDLTVSHPRRQQFTVCQMNLM